MTVKRVRKKKTIKDVNYNSKAPKSNKPSLDSTFDISSEASSVIYDADTCLGFLKPIDFTDEIESCIEPLKNALSYCHPCECYFFLDHEPKLTENVLSEAQEAYECSSEASSAFVSIMELDDSDCLKVIKAVKNKEFRKPNSLALPFKDEYLTVKSIKEKVSSEDSDSLQSSGMKAKDDVDTRYARPGWITGLHDSIGLGAYEWEKLVKSIIGQGRYGRNSSREPFFRFELPMDLHNLSNVSPLTYLENYCKISDRRMALYQKEFTKNKEPKGTFITKPNLFKSLNSIMVGTLSKDQFAFICDIIEINDETKLSTNAFAGVCAVTERFYFSKNLTSSSEESFEIQKGYIEHADFTNLKWKLRSIKMSENVGRLIRAL